MVSVKIEVEDLDEIIAFNTRKIMFEYGKEVRVTELDIKVGIRYYKKYMAKIKKLEDDWLFVSTQLEGKVSSSFIKMPENPQENDQRKMALIMKKSRIERDLQTYRYYVGIVDQFIETSGSLCPQNELVKPNEVFEIVKGLYVDHIKPSRLSLKYGIAERSIYNIIERAIERFVNVC